MKAQREMVVEIRKGVVVSVSHIAKQALILKECLFDSEKPLKSCLFKLLPHSLLMLPKKPLKYYLFTLVPHFTYNKQYDDTCRN